MSVVGGGGSKFKMRHKEEDNHEAWLMTYADFITLMASFFVLIISVSEPKQAKMEAIREGISGFVKQMVETPFVDTFNQLQLMAEENAIERDIAIEMNSNGIQIELASSAFFRSGSAEFLPEAIPILEDVAATLNELRNDKYHMEVQGHTDDVPVGGAVYPSNWELSTARASGVVRFLITKGMDPSRMKAAGFADVMPKVPNLDANRVQNRRVVIKVEKKQTE